MSPPSLDGQTVWTNTAPITLFSYGLLSITARLRNASSRALAAMLAQSAGVASARSLPERIAVAGAMTYAAAGAALERRTAIAVTGGASLAASGAAMGRRSAASGVAIGSLAAVGAPTIRRQATAGVAHSWTPADLSGLSSGFWVESDIGVSGATSGTLVWADQGTAGNSPTQATAGNKPAYNTATLNGIPLFTFDGSTSWLGLPTNVTAGAPSLFWAVLIPRLIGTASQTLLAAQKLGIYQVASTNSKWGYSDGAAELVSVLSVGTAYLLIINTRAVNDSDAWTNGTKFNFTAGTGYPTRSGTRIGADPTNVLFGKFDLGAMGVAGASASAANITQLRQFYSNKFAFAA